MLTPEEWLFLATVWASCLVDGGVAVGFLIRAHIKHHKVMDLRSVAVAVGLTTVVFLSKLIILAVLGVGLFGQIHLVYIDLVVIVPLIAVLVLVFSIRVPGAVTGPVKCLAGLCLIGPFVGWYATFWEPFQLRIETATIVVKQDRAGSEPIKIGVMTDLQTRHVSDYERRAVKLLLDQRPDIILLPGDIFQGSDEALEGQFSALRELLMQLDAPGGVFLVPGDVDQVDGRLEKFVEGTKIRLLVNQDVEREIKGRKFTIAGVELRYRSRAALELTERLETRDGTEDFRIVLGHRPDVVSNLKANSRVDLVVAGHTHGGQIVVPGFGPLITLSDVPRKVAAGGLHQLQGNAIYVSRGVGCERHQAPRMRFFCPPEISILTIKSAE